MLGRTFFRPFRSFSTQAEKPLWSEKLASYPNYDRKALKAGIVHMSMGSFHRAHQATYIHDYLQKNPTENWMIHSIGLLDQDKDLVERMRAQDCLFSVLERSQKVENCHVVGSIKQVTHAPTDPETVIAAIADPNTKVVTLTLTEKGYCYNADGALDLSHPYIIHEMKGGPPKSALGFLYRGLERREKLSPKNAHKLTVVSCDNLPSNGGLTMRLINEYATAIHLNERVAKNWIKKNVSFPNTMVDRITPAPTAEAVRLAKDRFGIVDPCALICEPYRTWHISKVFANDRPKLEKIGVTFVAPGFVHEYEKVKVRMLNGGHSAVAYVGRLMGYRTVHDALADPLIKIFLNRLLAEEVAPCCPELHGLGKDQFRLSILSRFSNPAINDSIDRVAQDGSAKIRNALVPPLEHQLLNGLSCNLLCFAMAAWNRFLRGTDERGETIEIVDPKRDELRALAADPATRMELIGTTSIFGPLVAGSIDIRRITLQHSNSIEKYGMRGALERLLSYIDLQKV